MAKVEPKFIQKELEAGKIRPLYWIHGPERMKARELIRRIEKAVLGATGKSEFNFEKFDGTEASLETVTDSFQSFSMMGGTKLLVIHHADQLERLDSFPEFLKQIESFQPAAAETFSSVAVFVGKGFDSRRKWAKAAQDQIAVVECEEVEEYDREQWIDYLAKRRSLTVNASEKTLLKSLDPWSLEIVDQELSKMEMVKDDPKLREEVILSGVDSIARDEFIDALFMREPARALKWTHRFGEDHSTIMPLLGLVTWNFRQLKQYFLEQKTRATPARRDPYTQKKIDRWKRAWTLESIHDFEESLFEIEYSLKTLRVKGQALWTNLILS